MKALQVLSPLYKFILQYTHVLCILSNYNSLMQLSTRINKICPTNFNLYQCAVFPIQLTISFVFVRRLENEAGHTYAEVIFIIVTLVILQYRLVASYIGKESNFLWCDASIYARSYFIFYQSFPCASSASGSVLLAQRRLRFLPAFVLSPTTRRHGQPFHQADVTGSRSRRHCIRRRSFYRCMVTLYVRFQRRFDNISTWNNC